MVGLQDWFFPGIRPNTPYASRWQSFLGDLQSQGVTVDPTQSGGFAPRNIRGTSTPSLHASDRAYDVNWRSNPEGSVQDEGDIARQHLERDMGGNAGPITRIHPMIARETATRHGMRWGGDFRTRSPDPMHFEVAGPAPGPMQNRSLVAHAGMSPPSRGPATMFPWLWGSAQAQTPAAPMGVPPWAVDLAQLRNEPPGSMLYPYNGDLQVRDPQTERGIRPATPREITNLVPDAFGGDWSAAQAAPPAAGGTIPSPLAGFGATLSWLRQAIPRGVDQTWRGNIAPPQQPAAQPPAQPPAAQPPAGLSGPSALDVGWQPPTPDVPPFQPPEVTPEPAAPAVAPQAAPAALERGAGLLAGVLPPEVSGFADRISNHPLLPALLATIGSSGPNWGSNAATALYQGQRSQRESAEFQRQQRQRSTMDRVWQEAFPNGQPNMQHPLLTGQSPQVAQMLHALGPDAALPLLGRSAMERRQLELKDIGGQGVIFDPRTGQVTQVPGTQTGKLPSGFRWAQGQEGQRMEPIPGGPGEQLPGEFAGRLALMQTARARYSDARNFFLNRMTIGEAGRHAIGGAMLAPGYSQAQRTAELAVESAIRAASGANAPEPEVQRYIRMFTPVVTDPPAVRKQKLDMLEEFMQNAEGNLTRGRGGPSSPAAPQQPTANDPLGIR